MLTPVLVSAALLLVFAGAQYNISDMSPLNLVVKNSILNAPEQTYSTHIAYRGILLGAMTRLMNSSADFNFTYTEDPNYGPFLQSVNGLAGNDEEHTYWELLVKTANDSIYRPNVGIGCYIPEENQEILLNFTTW